MKLYISGKIAGLITGEAEGNFALVQRTLEINGYETHNPYDTQPLCEGSCVPDDPEFDHAWSCYLRYDIIDMLKCDGVCLLWNFNDSKGSILELFVARQCGLPIRMWDAWEPLA